MKYLLSITTLCSTVILLSKPLPAIALAFIWTVVWTSVYIYIKQVTFEISISLVAFTLSICIVSGIWISDSSIVSLLLLAVLLIYYFETAKLHKQIYLTNKREMAASSELSKTNDSFQQIRGERHDFMKHISAVSYLIDSNQYEKANEYIKHYVDALYNTNTYMKGESGHIASVLYQWKQQAVQHNIELVFQLDYPLSQLPISKLDQMNLLINLLENAFDAAICTDKKQIKITSFVKSGIYILEVTNSTPSLSNELQDQLFKQFNQTTKLGSHEGLGTFVIHELVQQYNGYLDYLYQNQRLTIKVKFPIVV
ncbi:GHKL domain-containing protein [Bacillus sp. 1780r2a1]|uniref:sensor histidine kinase n=1 Tax=Priestia TaxID=2800373 RepID=UPI0021F99736|nr:GHKL domain-containing protein [Priestia flexa]MDT2047642.1 GHKL domain-containing protein [Priestia flexa]USY56244.1 GHKL domain-containing protein [Bacillus sp. 1780r2a1]